MRGSHARGRIGRRRWARIGVERLEQRDLLATFTVTNVNDSGPGSYRRAINDANSSPGADTIAFNIAGSQLHTIAPTSPLPQVTEAVTIDGFTQAGSSVNTSTSGISAVYRIAAPVPVIASGNSTIRGLVVTGGGIVLRGGNNLVVGNFVGTDSNGVEAPSRAAGAAPQTGISIESNGNTIGGGSPAARNLISGNNQAGILIQGGASSNQVLGNLIGTTRSGLAALGNGIGVFIVSGSGNSIGGTGAGEGNVISANMLSGVRIAPAGGFDAVANNRVAGNTIGLMVDGSGVLGNGNGLYIAAAGTTVGGSAAGAGNLISGNAGGGIGLFNATGSVIQQNKIGTGIGGMGSRANGEVGIAIAGGSNNVVGGTSPQTRNLISGNAGHGVLLSSPGAGTVVRGNWIGLKADGTTPLGNAGSGVRIVSASGELTIGGTIPPEGNVIAFNGNGGVVVESGTGATIRTNSIHSNAGMGIDLGADGPTPNDVGDADGGPNGRMNAPVITSVSSDGTISTIQGSLNSAPNATYTIQFFSNRFANPTNQGPGETYLGDAVVSTDVGGSVNFIATMPRPVSPGQPVSAVAIESSTGNTSEFSPNLPFAPDPAANLAVTVTTSSDTVTAGQRVTFTVAVMNLGPNPAAHVSLVSGLPQGALLSGTAPVSLSQGTFALSSGAVEASLGTIGAHASATATITVRRMSAGSLSAGALVYSAAGDSQGGNNGALKTVAVMAAPDVTIGVAAPTSVSLNHEMTYTFTATNPGPATATNVVVSHQLPKNVTIVSTTSSQGSVAPAGGVINAHLGTLGAGTTATVTVVARPGAAGALPLAAEMHTDTDSNAANNQASAIVSVVGPASAVAVRDLRTSVARGAIRGLVLAFSGAVDPVSASRASAYRITLLGRDGVLGTRDDRHVAVKSAVYDGAAHAVTVTTARKLPQNQLIGMTASGSDAVAILASSGGPIDGDGNGVPGGDYVGSAGRGRLLTYLDASGDTVTLRLSGPGSMELIRGPEGNARALIVSGTNARRSSLTGSVRRGKRAGNGVTPIRAISGLGTFRLKLKTPPFLLGPENFTLN
jgi:uncharacterized repeat protein (TIGR01451 family)